mgnify:CR=1 FL=1
MLNTIGDIIMYTSSISGLTAINFLNAQELTKNLLDLINYEPEQNAIIAEFKAKTMAGLEQVLSCFIEHDGKDFKISSIIGAKPSEVNIANLEFDLLSRQIRLS